MMWMQSDGLGLSWLPECWNEVKAATENKVKTAAEIENCEGGDEKEDYDYRKPYLPRRSPLLIRVRESEFRIFGNACELAAEYYIHEDL